MPKLRMLKLPKAVFESAQRIAVNNGVSVEEVVKKYRAATKKRAFFSTDFFWNHSDISLPRARRPSSLKGRAHDTRRARNGRPTRKTEKIVP